MISLVRRRVVGMSVVRGRGGGRLRDAGSGRPAIGLGADVPHLLREAPTVAVLGELARERALLSSARVADGVRADAGGHVAHSLVAVAASVRHVGEAGAEASEGAERERGDQQAMADQ